MATWPAYLPDSEDELAAEEEIELAYTLAARRLRALVAPVGRAIVNVGAQTDVESGLAKATGVPGMSSMYS